MTKKIVSKIYNSYVSGYSISSLQEEEGVALRNGWTNIRVDKHEEWGYSDTPSVYVVLMGDRLETDQEYESRLAQEAQQKEFWERREKEEFERLKKKFQGC